MSAVPSTPARTAAESVALPVALVARLALPAVFLTAVVYHALQSRGTQPRRFSTTSCSTRSSRRRSLPARARHPWRELLLPSSARTARAGVGLAAFVDDGCV